MGIIKLYSQPCGTTINGHLWNKAGFSVKCPARGSTAIVHNGKSTWKDVDEFVDEYCGNCKRRVK